jgi:hypothetical protein
MIDGAAPAGIEEPLPVRQLSSYAALLSRGIRFAR